MLCKSSVVRQFLVFFCIFCPTSSSGSNVNNDMQNELQAEEDKALENCDGPGTYPFTNAIFNGQCSCKRNVRGTYCTECKDNSFDLNYRHVRGCLKCYCSGLSRNCSSSDLDRDKIYVDFSRGDEGVTLLHRDLSPVHQEMSIIPETHELYVEGLPRDSNETYYWKLPKKFLGDQLGLYGGFINFTIRYENLPNINGNPKWLKDPLIVMKGNGVTIYYKFRKTSRRLTTHFLNLMDKRWYRLPTRNENRRGNKKKRIRARRRDVMIVLSNVKFILVKANYKPRTNMVGIQNFSMSTVTSDASSSGGTSEVATSVEKCECPEGYGGNSCQKCGDGYMEVHQKRKRSRVRSYKPPKLYCEKCQCNGRSESCHPSTGVCFNCQNNATGDHCEKEYIDCDPRGTFLIGENPARCQCKARVKGSSCDSCRRGHFNLDFENIKGCRKCWCNGVSVACSSSNLRRFKIRLQPHSAISLGFRHKNEKKTYLIKFKNGKALYKPYTKYRKINRLHWSLPKVFTGNLLKSYGGFLNFSMTNRGQCYKHYDVLDPLLELESFHGTVLRWKFKPPIRMNTLSRYSIKLTEDQFVYTYNPLESTRSSFLKVIKDLRSIRIFVPECYHISSTEIGDISVDTSTDIAIASSKPLALEVEKCECSAAYSGLSCEYCSPGYEFDHTKRCVRKTKLNYFHIH